MANFETTRVLGQVLGYGVGKSNNVPSANVASVQGKLAGDQLHVTFTTILTYDRTNPNYLDHQLRALREEASTVVNDYAAHLKKEFKEVAGTALKLKETSRTDDMQMTSYNSMGSKATAYFRLLVKYDVG
jgi:hypothetical protein